ncbi:hypothetical protein CLOM_g1149 [Closterium sp. NIES-68]|nr:hypothetical protein CLOM_g768 [Closterium sp. NIES-68]GJP41476.1 hypothetical protein CLOM_g1149 [Closterium sp. NIES-68]GJP65250.1 hypothetical protein CLOP_g22160 [Closterium sp. NIES-67]GJP77684.1 hypothetical protein CLOP_g8041 [Closterium sp. NIES-67]
MPPLSHLPFAISPDAMQILRSHRIATLEDFVMADGRMLRRDVEGMAHGRARDDALQAIDQLHHHMVHAMCMPAHASGDQLLRDIYREGPYGDNRDNSEGLNQEDPYGQQRQAQTGEEEEKWQCKGEQLQQQYQQQEGQEQWQEDDVERRQWKHATISTGCSSIDSLLGGGLPLAAVTEVTGAAGAGKTQFCLQAAAVAAISPLLSQATDIPPPQHASASHSSSAPQPRGSAPPSTGSTVAFVDTAGSFSAARIATVIGRMMGSRERCQESRATVTRALKAVVRMKAYDIHSLLSLLATIAQHKRQATQSADFFSVLRLLIIDSASAVVSPVLGGHGPQGHALMMSLSRMIRSLANEFGVAVLITNHSVSSEDGTFKPALGESWKVTPHVRLVLDRDYDSDYCQFTLARHLCLPGGASTVVKLGKYGILPAQYGG